MSAVNPQQHSAGSLTLASVQTARRRLASDDPDGEAEAIAPVRPDARRARGRRDEVISDTPLWRTLAHISDDPPEPLLFGMLEPGGPSLLYAAPGVGKGTTGAYLIVEALRAGMRPVVFDAERRPREWARRVAGLGGDRSRVIYFEPADLGPKLAGQPFWEIAPALRAKMKLAGADLFILDSILPASGVGEDRLRSDAQAPFLFVAALDSLDVASASFGHPPKGQPEGEPFGSMAWLAAFRLTWLGTPPRATGIGSAGARASGTSEATFPVSC